MPQGFLCFLDLEMKMICKEKTMKQRIAEKDFVFRRLKEKFPELTEFFFQHFEGTYYDRAYTEYYGPNGELLCVEQHSWYG